jgi:glycosyltransferase involved in cell wall biosynthesis
MDLVAEMLHRELCDDPTAGLDAERTCPPFRRRAGRVPFVGSTRAAFSIDRLLNRYRDYPRFLRGQIGDFDLFHVCDHSYAQLVHQLPGPRTGVYCHDLDTFRCLLEPRLDPRPRWFRALARRTLGGMQKAGVVFHNSMQTRAEVERHGLIDPARLVHAPLGVSAEFSPELTSGHSPAGGPPFLLHVGSCIPRKRIDVLLDVFAAVCQAHPDLRLVKVGGPWTAAQREQLARLDLEGRVELRNGLKRVEVAALYRTAALVLLPSEAEGFGLPVIEALACAAAVVLSDLPVLREVGGPGAVYCPVGDVRAWADTVGRLLADPGLAPSRAVRLNQARRFTWANHARAIAAAYRRLL